MSDITIHVHWHTIWMILAFAGAFAAGFATCWIWVYKGFEDAFRRIW